MGLTILSSSLSAFAPLFLAKAIDLLGGNSANQPIASSVAWLGGLYVGLIALTKLFNTGSLYVQSLLRITLVEAISQRYFKFLCDRNAQFFVENSVGSLAQQLNQTSNELYSFVRNIAFNVVSPLVQLVIAMVVIATAISSTIAYIFAGYTLLFVLNNYLFLKKLSPRRIQVMDAGRKSYSVLVDSVLNIGAVRQYNAFGQLFRRYQDVLEEDRKIQNGYWFLMFGMLTINAFLFIAMFAASLYVLIHASPNGQITAGEFALIATYVILLSGPIEMLGSTLGEAQQSMRSVSLFLSDVLRTKTPSLEYETIIPHASAITMEAVEFDYPASDRYHMGPISLSIRSGEKVTFTGETGAGKSSLIKLITGEFQSTRGTIKLFGKAIETIPRHSLNELIGVVTQDANIFSDTLRFNMQVARKDASDQEIASALASAGLPISDIGVEGSLNLNTQLGDRGVSLSGGQRQRISLARLFLRQPKIVVIDEGTSALDVLTERSVSEKIYSTFRDCTVLSVSHRLSAMAFSDQIYVLKEGSLDDSGAKDEVIRRNAYMQRLVRLSSHHAS